MNENFVTKAIKQDRYLKATRLADQFEEEIIRELENFSKEIIKENDGLFVDDVSPDPNRLPQPSSALATLRVDSTMSRVKSPDQPDNLTLNVALEWMTPEKRGEDTPDGSALCCVHYKIKNLSREDFEDLKAKTRKHDDWDVRFGEDMYSSRTTPGVVYIPVQSAAGIKRAFETLKSHFNEYADDFGVPEHSSTD